MEDESRSKTESLEVNTEARGTSGPITESRMFAFKKAAAKWLRYFKLASFLLIALVSAGLIYVVTIDLGPTLRSQAEQQFANYIDRPVHIGRLSTYLLPGRFLIEDLVIDGLSNGDRPFFHGERIIVSTAWLPLLRGEFLVDEVDMTGWRMLVESFEDGRHSFPPFAGGSEDDEPARTAASDEGAEPSRRFVTTVQFLRAHDGEFVYEDHGSPWSVVARNVDLRLRKEIGYGGQASFNGGTLQIGEFQPMTLSMDANYELDGGLVELSHIDLTMDGLESIVTGSVDLLNWPESTYEIVESSIDLPTMKDVFFAEDNFLVTGNATFTGLWHLFDGGRELSGTFKSADAALQELPFPALNGDLIWTQDRFEILRAESSFFDGEIEFDYAMKPLGSMSSGVSTFDVNYTEVELDLLFDALAVSGARPTGKAGGNVFLTWPIGRFENRYGDGTLLVSPPAGVQLQSRNPRGKRAREQWAYAEKPIGIISPWRFPMGAEIDFEFDQSAVAFESSQISTPLTLVEFDGQTAWGSDSHIPFHVVSGDWQESDRLMAAVMTAFGRPTGEIAVSGYGEMTGAMFGDFFSPRIEAHFEGDGIRAWNVDWDHGRGDIVVQGPYLQVSDGLFGDGTSELEIEGQFAIGPPPEDGDEINARFGLTEFPAQRLRDAFSLEGYLINGPIDGDIHLFGDYRQPYGYGALSMEDGFAYGEPFDQANAGLRFEGNGVWLDALNVRKGDGAVTGAMYIRWDGTYSVNADGNKISMGSVRFAESSSTSLNGLLRFSISGAGAFDSPKYTLDGTISGLGIAGASVGQLTGHLDVDGDVLQLQMEAASQNLAVSGSGRIELGEDALAEVRLRVTNTTLDPFIRVLQPDLPLSTSMVGGGSVMVRGPLLDIAKLEVDIVAELLDLSLFDYRISNDGPVVVRVAQNRLRVERMELAGDGTKLGVTGYAELADDEQIMFRAEGDASLGLLQGLFPEIRSTGDTRLEAEIGGSWRSPELSGQLHVKNGRVRHLSLPHSLETMEGLIVFDSSGILVDGLSARLADGHVSFGGRFGLDGFELGELDVSARAEGMNLRFPEGIRSTVDADLVVTGSSDSPTLGGIVNVRDAIWLEVFQPSATFFNFSGESSSFEVREDDEISPVNLDVRIVAPSSFRINDDNAQIVATADLALRGTSAHPLLFGNVEIERGQAFFEGNRYRVLRGSVSFSDPVAIEPFFDFEVETDIRVPGQTYRVTLGLNGTPDRLAPPELSSDPPLRQFEILGLLLGDMRDPQRAEIRTLRAREASQQEFLQAAGARLLTNPVSSGVGSVVERSFGVDTFEIVPSLDDPTVQQSTQLIPTARVLIGKRISDRAHVTVSRALSGANQDLIMLLEYDASGWLSWVLSQNEDRTYALDFRVRHSF